MRWRRASSAAAPISSVGMVTKLGFVHHARSDHCERDFAARRQIPEVGWWKRHGSVCGPSPQSQDRLDSR